MKTGDKVVFMLGIGIGKGEIVKNNNETVIVKLSNGNTIKRHKEKHDVRLNQRG